MDEVGPERQLPQAAQGARKRPAAETDADDLVLLLDLPEGGGVAGLLRVEDRHLGEEGRGAEVVAGEGRDDRGFPGGVGAGEEEDSYASTSPAEASSASRDRAAASRSSAERAGSLPARRKDSTSWRSHWSACL